MWFSILRLRVRTALLLVAIGACIAGAIINYPRSMPLPINESMYTGYYTGLGLTDDVSPVGRRFYRVHVEDKPCGYWEVDFRAAGYNPYRGYYPSGVLRESGECLVEILGSPRYPAPDNHAIRNARFYRPDGMLGSVVEDGTGVQTYWYPDGKLRWRLELRDYVRVQSELWDQNGRLVGKEVCRPLGGSSTTRGSESVRPDR
jgi:hypothetical protein